MPRTKKSAEDRRSRHAIFRLTEQEYQELRAAAERAGLPPNELARRIHHSGLKVLVIKTYRRTDPAFLMQLNRIGNNLNQVVKSAHTFGRLPPSLYRLCEFIERIVTQAIEEDMPDDP